MSFQKLDDLGHKLEALEHALAILGADEATHMAVGGGEKRAEAMAALAGMLVCPLVVVLALALVYAKFAQVPQVAGGLRGMGAVAAGLITATGLKLFGALRTNVLGLALCVALGLATFVGIALLRWPLAWVLLGLGGLACVMAWQRLGARA